MRRVVVTGIGLVTPVGVGRVETWEALLAGRSGIDRVRYFDTSALPVHLGAEVTSFAPERFVRRQPVGSMGRASHLAIAAARLALEDGGIDPRAWPRERVAVLMGTTSGEAEFIERYNDCKQAGGLTAVPGALPGKYPCNVIPARVAAEFDARGPCLTIPTACAAGNYAVGYGFDLIRGGRADLALAGGSDPFSRINYTGFARLGAIAPERCQPFDRHRRGMIPGEGSAMLVLEEAAAAAARGATIYAEVLGYGVTCDAHHMTAAHPQGDGAVRAMAMAMRDSGVTADEIDYVSAHGTGTATNDRVESLALKRLFGDRARTLPMSSIKSMIGHTMGAASAIEAAVCALALSTGWVPPTINFETADPDCEVDCVPNTARRLDPAVVLNNAYAFGGNNASLCLARVERHGSGAA
jgi:3-oxoacyl-[acyl-carrier-protein] synthase II